MRLNLNLASQPYGDVRRFMVRWAVVLGALTLVTCVLTYGASMAMMSWRIGAREQNRLQAQIAQRDKQRAAVQALLSQPQNRDVRERSTFLNEVIARKALSWTLVLSDLEKLMPSGLQVSSITPKLNDAHELEVQLVVNGYSRSRAIELVRQLENSPRFADAEVRSESELSSNTGRAAVNSAGANPAVQFTISAIYVPSAPASATAGGR